MAHRGHNSVSAGVEGSLDHPFFCPGDPDNRAGAFGTNGIIELH